MVRVYLVSCPDSDAWVEVTDEARPGDEVECGGRRYRLTYEYESWALEPLAPPPAPA